MAHNLITLLIIFAVLTFLLFIMSFFMPKSRFTMKSGITPENMHQCTMNSCTIGCGNGEIANVSDPVFNMKEIVKQSLLLEDHLVQKEKRCRDCIAKHFLLCISYSEEAVWLAGDSIQKYPLLPEAISLYNKWFDRWLNAQDDIEGMLSLASEIRLFRKQLVAEYYLKGEKQA